MALPNFKDVTELFKTGANDKKDGPYCQRCHDEDSILVRLQEGFGMFEETTTPRCLVCGHSC
jgi:DNA-directed RNA polymerase subunit M/transcription elongation factor TFIIS